MRRIALALCIALFTAGAVGCGSAIPLPVPATPTAAWPGSPPLLRPPPEVVDIPESPGICSHAELGAMATFHGHYNASDSAHYHGWRPPVGKVFWVRC